MSSSRVIPRWVITEDYLEEELGTLSSGKEAGCFLVRRTDAAGRWCLLVRKDYRKRSDRTYSRPVRAGERTFRRDRYNEGAVLPVMAEGGRVRGGGGHGDERVLRAVAKRTQLGKEVIEASWLIAEFEMLRRVWEAGVRVPFPVSLDEHAMVMQYVGTIGQAAPRLADIRPRGVDARELYERVVAEFETMTAAGVVHGDLSAYNILVQDGRPWIIDLPQAVDLYANRHGPEMLRRDARNVCAYFAKRGVPCDGDVLADRLLAGG